MEDRHPRRPSPPFIYGTAWKEEETRELTLAALECGFRAIDTANQRKHYHEAGVGEALAEAFDAGTVSRDDLFVQTKFTYAAGQDHRMPYEPEAPLEKQIESSFETSLEHLGVEFIDSYVLHGPSTRSGLGEADWRVWETMEKLKEQKRVGTIGVSNVSAGQLETLAEEADHPPAYVQNRCFARTGWDRKVREICDEHDIGYQGFSLLTANGRELQSDAIARIANRHGRTVPQVIFRFALEVGMIPLTGTTSETHMEQDLACVDFELEEEEVETIEGIATG